MAVALDAVWVRVKGVCKQNGLLILSVLAVVIGCLLGFFLRTKQLSEQVSATMELHKAPVRPAQTSKSQHRSSKTTTQPSPDQP